MLLCAVVDDELEPLLPAARVCALLIAVCAVLLVPPRERVCAFVIARLLPLLPRAPLLTNAPEEGDERAAGGGLGRGLAGLRKYINTPRIQTCTRTPCVQNDSIPITIRHIHAHIMH